MTESEDNINTDDYDTDEYDINDCDDILIDGFITHPSIEYHPIILHVTFVGHLQPDLQSEVEIDECVDDVSSLDDCDDILIDEPIQFEPLSKGTIKVKLKNVGRFKEYLSG